jgi:hypothetical protein
VRPFFDPLLQPDRQFTHISTPNTISASRVSGNRWAHFVCGGDVVNAREGQGPYAHTEGCHLDFGRSAKEQCSRR